MATFNFSSYLVILIKAPNGVYSICATDVRPLWRRTLLASPYNFKVLSKMANVNLRRRFKEAQKVDFPDIEDTCNNFIAQMIGAHSDAIGCPKEFIYFPFISTCAGNFV